MKTRTKKVKDEPVTEPEVETPVETAAEPAKTKRELFKEKADAESSYRAKEAKLKEREAAAQAAEEKFKAFESDPIKFLEEKDPRFYEKLTERYLSEGMTPEKAEVASLRAEIDALREQITGTKEHTTKEIQLAKYERDLNDGERILSGTEFDTVRESASLYEKFTGQPTDFRRALAGVWIEYKQTYQKELTPAECCEILLEDAQAHVDRVAAEFGQKPAERSKPPKKKTPPPPGKTLTQTQETQSAPAEEIDFSQIKNKQERLQAIADTLEYMEVPEE